MKKQIIHYIASFPNITTPNFFAEQIAETRTTLTVKIIDVDFSAKTGATGNFTHEFAREERAHLREFFVGQVRKYRKGIFQHNEIGAGTSYILLNDFAQKKLRARARRLKKNPMGLRYRLAFATESKSRGNAWLKRLDAQHIAAATDFNEVIAYDDHHESKADYLISKGFKLIEEVK